MLRTNPFILRTSIGGETDSFSILTVKLNILTPYREAGNQGYRPSSTNLIRVILLPSKVSKLKAKQAPKSDGGQGPPKVSFMFN